MEANFGFGRLYYPTNKIEKYIEPFRLKTKEGREWPEEGWEVFQSDTNDPDEKYIHPKIYKKQHPNINLGYYLQIERIDELDILSDDGEADREARKYGFIVDEFGIVQGYGDRNIVFEENPGYIPFLIKKIEEEPTIYKEIEKSGYIPKEIREAFPELARGNSSGMWGFKKNNEKYMKTTFNEFLNESAESGKWFISYGLGGGFGGASNYEVIDAESQEEADQYAWEMACEDYEQYVGNHGLRDIDEIMDEEGVDEEEAAEIYNEEREGWLDYSAEPYNPAEHDKYL